MTSYAPPSHTRQGTMVPREKTIPEIISKYGTSNQLLRNDATSHNLARIKKEKHSEMCPFAA